MKKYIITLVLILTIVSFAKENEKAAMLKLNMGEKESHLGLYVGANTRYTSVNEKGAGMLDIKAGLTINDDWAVGISASGLYYDRKLNEVVDDGKYHLQMGYVGIFVEKYFSVSDNVNCYISLLSGTGEASYIYDKEVRKEKAWYQRTIDKVDFHLIEPGLGIEARVAKSFWIGINGNYRFTSNLELLKTSSDVFKKFSGGLTFKYKIF